MLLIQHWHGHNGKFREREYNLTSKKRIYRQIPSKSYESWQRIFQVPEKKNNDAIINIFMIRKIMMIMMRVEEVSNFSYDPSINLP